MWQNIISWCHSWGTFATIKEQFVIALFINSEDEILKMVREVSDDKKNDSLEFNEFLKVIEIIWVTR